MIYTLPVHSVFAIYFSQIYMHALIFNSNKINRTIIRGGIGSISDIRFQLFYHINRSMNRIIFIINDKS